MKFYLKKKAFIGNWYKTFKVKSTIFLFSEDKAVSFFKIFHRESYTSSVQLIAVLQVDQEFSISSIHIFAAIQTRSFFSSLNSHSILFSLSFCFIFSLSLYSLYRFKKNFFQSLFNYFSFSHCLFPSLYVTVIFRFLPFRIAFLAHKYTVF